MDIPHDDEASNTSDEVQEWILAKRGLKLLINNKPSEAERLFLRYPDSLVMFSGYSFTVFMDALMSFEDDKLSKAVTTLKEVERRCTSQSWFKSVKTKLFRGTDVSHSLAESLENQIILADSQVCLGILIFLQQDLSGYFKAGWVLRKAWKIYQSVYKEIRSLYETKIGELILPDPRKPVLISESSEKCIVQEKSILESESDEIVAASDSTHFDTRNLNIKNIDKKTLIRLMNAISFGYGLFQLGVSLLPPTMLRLTSFLGLNGDRTNGMACLMYARLGIDMRAPLATLALLWYHTIVRPFYSIDGSNVQAGVNSSLQLIQECNEEYSDSALFLFFKGRIYRLNSNISLALQSFQASVNNAPQREIKLLSMHEVGWCHLIQLDYANAESTFAYLTSFGRWSKPFYSYLTAICMGSAGKFDNYTALTELLKTMKPSTKMNQLDNFLTRRINCFPSNERFSEVPPVFWKIFTYEILYLWNSLPSCSPESIDIIIKDCEPTECDNFIEPMPGVARLVQGYCYWIQEKKTEAIDSYKEALKLRKDVPASNSRNTHILAFSQYELGSILIKDLETKEEGKCLLQQTLHIKDYDFEQRLAVRVNSLLNQV